jgi:hypothetical protein
MLNLLQYRGNSLVHQLNALNHNELMEYFDLLGIQYVGKTVYLSLFLKFLTNLVENDIEITNEDIKDFIILTSTPTQTLNSIQKIINFYNTDNEEFLH